MGDVLYVINPAGHGGAGTKTREVFQQSWTQPIDPDDVIVTQRPGHAREIATSAARYTTIAAVGGDGTVGEIMSAIMDRGDPDLRLAIIPAGTGNMSTLIPGVLACEPGTIKALESAFAVVSVILRVGHLCREKPEIADSVSEPSKHVSSQIISIANWS